METLAVRHLSFRFPETETEVLRDVSFTVNRGEFVTLCGLSGSGKTTLLRHLKPALTPHGSGSGKVLLGERELQTLSLREQSETIGFVQQSPDNQLVTDKVWHELAFGLENLGLSQELIRRRVAETASYFGLQQQFEADVSQLSGGQKQLVNLAAVMAMQPEILLLDEPTAQLDPIAAANFLACLTRINRELGTTVILTEHRLEEVLPVSDRVLVLENGQLISNDTPANTGKNLKLAGSGCFFSLPAPMKIWERVENSAQDCPVTVTQGRAWLAGYARTHTLFPLDEEQIPQAGKTAVTLQNVWFRYEKNTPDVLKGLNLEVKFGEILTIMGGNGTGKSTLISLINGSRRPYSGKVYSCKELCLTLPQNPQVLFYGKTVWETLTDLPPEQAQQDGRFRSVIRLCQIGSLLNRHPFDLSGGEMQKVALAKLLLLQPKVLLLDEPTKGLDAQFKQAFAHILQQLAKDGTAVVMISHDMAFCARYSHRCLLLFNGDLAAGGTPRSFFGTNSFYVTAAARMAKTYIPAAVTAEDVIYACTGERDAPPSFGDSDSAREVSLPKPANDTPKLPLRKKVFGSIGALLLAAGIVVNVTPIAQTLPLWLLFGCMAVPVIVLMLTFGARAGTKEAVFTEKQKLSKRTVAAAVIILLLIPVTIGIGVTVLQDQKYLFISLLVMLEGMLPFFLVFEGRKPQARELVLIAVLCALTVAGRTAFAALPQIKPVLALVIISGASLGGETGFMVGAVSMLVSNIYFGQGAWTPWQMFAAGIIGFLAGILFQKGSLLHSRGALCVFGFAVTLVLYGGIMNFSSLVLAHAPMNFPSILTFIAQGLPFDIIHACSTTAFLFFFAVPMLEKLNRVKTKYGLIQQQTGSRQAA